MSGDIVTGREVDGPELTAADLADVQSVQDLAQVLRRLRRREARRHGSAQLTYRELAAKTGWSRGILGEYFGGRVLPPTQRFDVLIRLLDASPAEQRALATTWDRVEENRHGATVPSRQQVPRQLPPDIGGFTGRAEPLAAMDRLISAGRHGSAVVISAVSGTAGVGKTALAVHWAHRAAALFGDGQLYVDLRGYDPDQPVQPSDALAAFMRALGVDSQFIPHALAERVARYRTLLAERRVLLLLDNAKSTDQVRPLLPGSASCVVLVTSRDSLAGLVARDGAHRIELDLLTVAEATTLLGTLIGERVPAEPAATTTLIRQCARLPLALRIVAEIAAARPGQSLAELATELADQRRRLDLLRPSDDERSAVRTVFSWSYRQLPAAAARLFRRLGLHPGIDYDHYAAAALTDTDPAAAGSLLGELARAHLVAETPPGRYRMHDLLRTYAAELAQEEIEPERRSAQTRLLDHYLATAAATMDLLYPAEHHVRPRVSTAAAPAPVSTAEAALGWLDAERDNLVAAVGLAAGHGWPTHAGHLTATITRYLQVGDHYSANFAMHGHALRAAKDQGDRAAEAAANIGLGGVSYYTGRYEHAVDNFTQAVAGFRAAGDRHGAARALGNLGLTYAQLGRHDKALDLYQQVLTIAGEIDDRLLEATHLGWAGAELGRLGRYEEATSHLRRAHAMHHELGYSLRVAETLANLGQVHLWAARHADALAAAGEALAVAKKIGNRYNEARAHNLLAEVHRADGRLDQALTHHRAALITTREIHRPAEQARALDGIAHVLHTTGQSEAARRLWQQALDLYLELNMPEGNKIRTQLAALDRNAPPT